MPLYPLEKLAGRISIKSIREITKAFLARWVMALPRFNHPPSGAMSLGARIVLYHEIPAELTQLFSRQLEYFSRWYKVVSMDELAAALKAKSAVDGWLAITFDDGFKNNVEVVSPLLQKWGITACFFIPTQFISLDPEDGNGYRYFAQERFRRPDPLPSMTWDDARMLIQQGFSIGSHSQTHPNLGSINWLQAREEIRGSYRDIAENVFHTPKHFAWPFGHARHFSENLREMVREAGYDTCCSSDRGSNVARSLLLNLNRDHLEPHWPIEVVRFFLEGGYDWVRRFGFPLLNKEGWS